MNVKGEVLLQLFNKSKLRNETKTYLEQFFSLSLVKFKKLGFSAPLNLHLSDTEISASEVYKKLNSHSTEAAKDVNLPTIVSILMQGEQQVKLACIQEL